VQIPLANGIAFTAMSVNYQITDQPWEQLWPAPILVCRPRAAGGRPLAGLEVVEKLLTSKASRLADAGWWHHGQVEHKLLVGACYQDSGLVFTWPDGSTIHPLRFSRWFEGHARRAGLPKIRLHDLRHSYASAALAAGVPAKVISERLGHATIAVTMDIYSHVLPGLDREAADSVARLILGGGAAAPEVAVNKPLAIEHGHGDERDG
jgi:hypothetical protein